MALVSLRQLLDYAAEQRFAVPAFNISNMEQVQAIMQAADACDSPVIMQGSAGANRYAGEVFLRHLILAAVEQYPHIPVVMHRDHAPTPSISRSSVYVPSLLWLPPIWPAIRRPRPTALLSG